jgi:hypothetical protein
MLQMITGYWITQVVHAAAQYSLADHLARRPMSATELAAAEELDGPAVFRFLRACASLGLVTFDGTSKFAATPLLNTLRRDNPQSLRGLALSQPAPGHWLPWGRFAGALKSGKSQTVAALGDEIFTYFARTPVEAEAFTEAMGSLTAAVASEAARLIDTRSAAVAVDIGGAGGTLLYALLGANPTLKGIVFDLPNIVMSAAAAAKLMGLSNRVATVGGNFFERVPAADLYLLKYILHDWNDEECVTILRNCRRAMPPGARLAVIELILTEMGQRALVPLMDLNMMVMLSGRERTLAEYDALLQAADLRVTVVKPTATPMAIIEAVAA